MRITLILTAVLTLLAGVIYNFRNYGTIVLLSNQNSEQISDIRIQARNNDIEAGSLVPGQTLRVRLPNTVGDSDITVIFGDSKVWQGGYIQDGYKVRVTFRDSEVLFEHVSF